MLPTSIQFYTRAESNERLKKLFEAGKILASELGISPKMEDSKMLSRRVHALEVGLFLL